MEERTFDLTVPVTRPFRVIWTIAGVGWIICGIVNVLENTILGTVQIVLGLGFLGFSGSLQRLNRYIVTFSNTRLEIERGLFRHRRISWTSVSEMHIELMKLGFKLDNGKNVKIDFTALSYNDNQTIKPEMIATASAFAEDKRIDVKDSRSP